MKILLCYKNSGFTLIELMVTLSVLAIIVSLSGPSFTHLIKQQKASTEARKLISLIFLGRSEAIKANKFATLCHSNNALQCNGIWSDGWLLFIDNNKNAQREPGEQIIKSGSLGYDYQLSLSAFGSQHHVKFTPLGLTLSQNGTFKLCPKDNDRHYARAIIFSKTARARLAKDNNGDGIYEAANGIPLSC